MKRFLAILSLFVISSLSVAQVRSLPDFADLVEKQGPAVVNIGTTKVIRSSAFPRTPFDEDDPMFELFRRFMPRQPGLPREFENRSLGSGFIISSDGHILTNAHVIDSADEITVRLTDKREFKAKVIGADKRTDVALIKIEATQLPVVKMGAPDQLRVGEWVVAIGSPFGFENSVTAGIVSAKGRSLPQENFVPFIQTDVAVNPGNSGGPLFNMKGEVVGINSQIYSRSGGFMGLSFAIPIDVAMEVKNQLLSHGKVSRGRLGVVIQEINKDLAESLGLPKPMGAAVSTVEKGSPAEKAGMEPGDVILKFDGRPVNHSADLPRLVGNTRPGSKSVLQVWRKGGTRDLAVTIGEMLEEKPNVSRVVQGGKSASPTVPRLGIVVSELSAEQKRDLKINSGLLIEEVANTALRADLRPGDIILSLIHKGNSNEVKTVHQFNQLLSGLGKGSHVTLLVRRGEMQTFVTIKGLSSD